MKYSTIKFGHDEINYGDVHFRRSDNAYTTQNPFVGNYLMDAYATMVLLNITTAETDSSEWEVLPTEDSTRMPTEEQALLYMLK